MKRSALNDPLWRYSSDTGWEVCPPDLFVPKPAHSFRIISPEGEVTVSREEFLNELMKLSSVNFPEDSTETVSVSEGNERQKTLYLFNLVQREIQLVEHSIAFGIFKFKTTFDKSGSGKLSISGLHSEGLMALLEVMGYRRRCLGDSNSTVLIQVVDNKMRVVNIEMMKNAVLDIIKELGQEVEFYKNGVAFPFGRATLITLFLDQQHNFFNQNKCEMLEMYDAPELKDGKDWSYFLFRNLIVRVSSGGKEYIQYADLGGSCVWEAHIIDHDFKYVPYSTHNSSYVSYSFNVSNRDSDRMMAFQSGTGYVLNHYTDSSMGQALILYDEKPTSHDLPSGGTGKGVYGQAISKLRQMAKIDGKFFDPDDKFRYQSVKETTQVAFIDDLKPSVPFTTFFSALTDGWTIERKHEKQIKLSPEQSPKLMFASNTVIGGLGTSDKRRQFILEFSDYYSQKISNGTETPITSEHGGMLFGKNWSNQEWNRFYSFMLDCSQFYFLNGLLGYELKGVGANRLIQECGEEFAEWVENQKFETYLEYTIPFLYQDYLELNYDGDQQGFKQRAFTTLLKRFAALKGWKLHKYFKGTHPNKVSCIQFRTAGQ